jgi:hypothetical protein
MSDRGSDYSKCFTIEVKSSDGKKTHEVCEIRCNTCLRKYDHSERKDLITVKCTRLLLDYLLDTMNLSSSGVVVEKIKKEEKMYEIIVYANVYTFQYIPNLISRMCSDHIYWNISPDDANEIITRLRLSDYVFCVQGDRALGACLVILLNSRTYRGKELPKTIFRDAYREFNQSRTVVMTRAQRDKPLSEEMKSSVEFTSVLPDGQIEVVFRREAIRTVVPEIKKQVEIDNLRRRLEELTSSSK